MSMENTLSDVEKAYAGTPKICDTCEFNFGNTCAGGTGEEGGYAYGERITNPQASCSGWDISFDAFCAALER